MVAIDRNYIAFDLLYILLIESNVFLLWIVDIATAVNNFVNFLIRESTSQKSS